MTRATLQGKVNSTGPSFKSRHNTDYLLRMNLGSRPSFKISSPIPQHPSPQTAHNIEIQAADSIQNWRLQTMRLQDCSIMTMCVRGPPESCREQNCLSRVFEMTNSMACHRETAASICVCEPPESCNEQNGLSRAFEMSNLISSHDCSASFKIFKPASKPHLQPCSNFKIRKNASLHATNSMRN